VQSYPRNVRIVGSSLVFALVLGAAAPARADEEPWQAARAHYEQGVDLANRGEYRSALEAFEAAYSASPHFAVLYNIGQAQVALGRARKAIEALSRYLLDGKEQIPASRRQQVERQIAQLEAQFVDLSVTTEPEGAEVTVDGRDVGRTPLSGPVRLAAGTHVVGATRPGTVPASRVVTLAEGERQSLTLALPPSPLGTLSLQCWELGAQPFLDGEPVEAAKAAAGVPVGPGRHRVAFAGLGKRWPEQNVEVPFGVRAAVFCGSSPPGTRETAPSPNRHPQAQSSFPTGHVLLGAGVAVGIATVLHYAWNAGRNTDWQVAQTRIETGPSDGRRERQIENNALADSIDRASVVTVGLGVASGALVTGGIAWLLLEGHEGSGAEQGLLAPGALSPLAFCATEHSANLAWRGTW